jgi:hypothetical protein
VVDAALGAGVSRVIQESVAMICCDGADRWLDEDWPTDHYPIAGGNHAAEANARRFSETSRSDGECDKGSCRRVIRGQVQAIPV